MRRLLICLFAVILGAPAARGWADAAILIAEPYGRGAGYNPTGHVGLYLTRVCAETPTSLRRCRPGEPGVVVSRYNKLGDVDWVAVPLIPYLYAVERPSDVPTFASPETVETMREQYRQAHLQGVVPDPDAPAARHWRQLIGGAYDRQFVALSVRTTPEQDDALIEAFNSRDNRRRFHALRRNCADFVRTTINEHYYPGALRRNLIGDLGVTTPKQVARSLARHAQRHPDAGLTVFVVQQVPGNRPTSRRTRGILESFVRTKKYALPLAFAQPWLPAGLAAGYLVTGRFNPHRLAESSVERLQFGDWDPPVVVEEALPPDGTTVKPYPTWASPPAPP